MKKNIFVFHSSNLIVFLTEVACIFLWPQGTCLVCLMINPPLALSQSLFRFNMANSELQTNK